MRNIKEVNVEAYKYLIVIPPRFVFYPSYWQYCYTLWWC